jgi:predicted nuclease of predicted toxin-antitoxin system
MKPLDWPLLADENIHPDVIQGLLNRGKDVRGVRETTPGLDDRDVLRMAHHENRVVLTHDSDFGRLVVLDGEPFTGIVYLRPGHFSAAFVLGIIDALEASEIDVQAPFLLVAERHGDQVRLRLRDMTKAE